MSASSEDVVVLIAGSDPIADGLSTALAARGADVQQLSAALAVDVIVASVPDAVLLVGDAAKQRGAMIRSQLVRRMRGTDVSMAVLVDGPVTLTTGNALRLVSRSHGVEVIADRLMEIATAAAASRSKGTLDQVATMVSAALERPSQPAPAMQVPTPSRIVMTATPSGAPTPARQTIRVPGAIPAPAKIAPVSTPAQQLSLAPPTSLQAIAARRIEITKTTNNPPPLPQDTEVSLADVRIETDRISGEVSITRAEAPPLPVKVERANPTPSAWSTDVEEAPIPLPRRQRVSSARWAAIVAVAACVGLLAWSSLRTSEPAAEVAQPSANPSNPRTAPPIPHGVASTPALERQANPKVARDEAADEAEEDLLVAAQAVGGDASDGEDPVGDEPHLVRARQLCNEGHALRTRGRLGLAEAKYLQALGLFPQYPRALAGVVRVHLTRGDGAEAVRWAERLIAMQPNRSNNQLLLGDAYALSGKAHDARRHWRKSAAFGNSIARKRLKDDGPVLAKPTR